MALYVPSVAHDPPVYVSRAVLRRLQVFRFASHRTWVQSFSILLAVIRIGSMNIVFVPTYNVDFFVDW